MRIRQFLQIATLYLVIDRLSHRHLARSLAAFIRLRRDILFNRDYHLNNDLHSLLKYCYTSIPYFYEIAEEGSLVGEFNSSLPVPLEQIPVLSKSDVIEHGPSLLPTNITERLTYSATNGSTGIRIRVPHGPSECDWTSVVTLYCRQVYSHYLWNTELHVSTDTRSSRKRDRIKQKIKELGLSRNNLFIEDLTDESVTRYLRRIRHIKPNLLHGPPSVIAELARKSIETNLRFNLNIVETSGESLFQSQRKIIEEAFQCKVVNRYGLAEAGVVAYQMPNDSDEVMTILEPSVILRLDNNTNEILLTNLHNQYFPVINYRTGDYAESIFVGEDGQMKIKAVKGKCHHLFSFGQSVFSTSTLEDIVLADSRIVNFQIVLSLSRELSSLLLCTKHDSDDSDILQGLIENLPAGLHAGIRELIMFVGLDSFRSSGSQNKILRVHIDN